MESWLGHCWLNGPRVWSIRKLPARMTNQYLKRRSIQEPGRSWMVDEQEVELIGNALRETF